MRYRRRRKDARESFGIDGRKLFSNDAWKTLRATFRKARLFRLYRHLRADFQDLADPPARGFAKEVPSAVSRLLKDIPDKRVQVEIGKMVRKLKSLLERYDEDRRPKERLLRRIIPFYAQIIYKLGQARDVPLKIQKLRKPGWIRFELGRPEEADRESHYHPRRR